MQVNLFQLSPKLPARSSVRFFEGAIIAAASLEQALRTHPASTAENQIRWSEADQRWMSHWKDGTRRPYINTTWPDHPSKVTGLLIAKSVDAMEHGVVLAAQNRV